MKFNFKNAFILAFFSLIIYSCSDPSVQEHSSQANQTDTKPVSFKNLKAQIPANYPEALLKYGPDDLQLIAAKGEVIPNMRLATGNNFHEIVKNILQNHPSFDSFEPKNYKKYFPELSEIQIQENSETILDFMEKLMGYEVAVAMAALPNGGNLRVASPGDGANSCELWYYGNHLRLDLDGIEYAREKAPQYTNIYYGSGAATVDHTKPNSFMHAVWNIILGKHAAYRYAEVWKAREVVKGLTDAHECNSDNDQKQMDFHNNDVGLQYFNTNAERFKKNLVDWNVRLNRTPQEYCDYIYGTVSNQIPRGTPVSANNVTRVYYD